MVVSPCHPIGIFIGNFDESIYGTATTTANLGVCATGRPLTKSEEELKALYLQLFADDLKNEWAAITEEAHFSGVSEDDIVKAIQKARYRH